MQDKGGCASQKGSEKWSRRQEKRGKGLRSLGRRRGCAVEVKKEETGEGPGLQLRSWICGAGMGAAAELQET